MISSLLIWFGKERKYSKIMIYADINPDMIL